MKIKYKIAGIFSLTSFLIIGFIGGFLYFLFANNIEKQFRERLLERAIIAAEVLLEKDNFSPVKYERVKARFLQTLPEENVYYIETENGNIDYGGLPADIIDKSSIESSLSKKYEFYQIGDLKFCSLYYEDNEGDFIILISAKNTEGIAELYFLQKALLIIILISLLIIAGVSLLFAKQILKPINRMILKVEEISGSNLQLRLNEGKGKDEISRLAKNFNRMLSRIESTFFTQKNFIQNASHELRTPLTVILGEAEFALKSSALSPDDRLAFQKVYQQADHLRELLNSLLHLSEIKNPGPSSEYKLLRIDEVIQKTVIKINQTFPSGVIHLEYKNIEDLNENSFVVPGNDLWLEIAFTNILDNALKYSNNEPVKVLLEDKPATVCINIEDQGIGIQPQDLSKIFSPFHRGNNAKSRKGYGIGLALTENIIKIHKGSIEVTSIMKKGSNVIIELPKDLKS
ncbi:HAMP domain-containing histidine kinase [Antarcticibacterium arcticum]|uniref:histidine kinase n=1 Tax=Antarcticibacterium arcticum TaxID=2585771 RepID=A0A5B8YJV9_9FLAO|nr:HAMP domain-containing sensor histidine kinase [Antarcticibacterium arcticum]QED36903.1 HAMP domain-containing histidine kinase [Antarcticibacterium arcticum]